MAKMEFKKGDGVTHYFYMPADSWTAGGTLFFIAKNEITDLDAAAIIDEEFSDSVVTDETGDDNVAYKKYTLYFAPSVTSGIAMGTAKKRKLFGEFQWVSSGGVPSSFPGNDDFIDVIVYADLRNATT